MTELHVTADGRRHSFQPGSTVRIGRSTENDVVVSDPTVSRQHAQVSWEGGVWVWQNTGNAATFVNGQPVGRFAVSQAGAVALASPQGPVVRLEPAQPAGQPLPTQLASPGVALGPEPATPATNLAQDRPPAAGLPWTPGAARQPDGGGQAPGAGQQPWAPGGQPQAPAAGQQPWAPGGQPQAPAAGQQPWAPAGQPQAPAAGQQPWAPAGQPQAPAAGQQPWAPGGQPQAPAAGQQPWAPAGQPQAGAAVPPAAPYGLPPGAAPVVPRPGPPVSGMPANPLEILIPIRSWLTDRGWRQGLRLLVIPYALLPLIFIALFAKSGNLTTPGWAYSLFIAPLWLLAFWYLIRPPGKFGPREVLIGVGIVAWTLIWLQVVTININSGLGGPNGLSFTDALVVGFNEEITKALPILIAASVLLIVRKQKLDPRMWMIFGCIAGLTFGVREQTFYTVQDILGINQAKVNGQAVIAVLAFAERIFVDGLQHAVWAGISAFFIGIALNYRRRMIPLIILGVTMPAILHALNDWSGTAFNTLWIPIIIQTISLLLFLGYTLSAGQIVKQVRRSPAFRGQSILMEQFSQTGEAPVVSPGPAP